MKKLAPTAVAGVVGLTLALSGAAVARSQATAVDVSTTMTAAQEVPTPKGDVSNARGTFSATITKSGSGAVLEWRLTFSGLTGRAIAAHIHIAPRGQAGNVAVPLCTSCDSGMTGRANINATVLNAILSGNAYANVHTPTNGAGEIRGQVAVVDTARTALTARQEVPRPKGNVSRARGTFTATVTKSGPSAVLSWRLTFSRLTGRATQAHIHIGKRGKAGPVAVALCAPCRSGAHGRKTMRGRALAALQSGRAYVNVHTRRNPLGEIRGQLPAVALTIS